MLKQTIDVVNGKIDQTIKEINKSVADLNKTLDEKIAMFFALLRREISSATAKLDSLLTKALCEISPSQIGHYIGGLPLGENPHSVTIWWPADKQCFAKFSESSTSPWYVTFTGLEYYEGMMCELELEIKELDPEDGLTIPRMSYYYRRLAVLAEDAVCEDKITTASMIERQLRYEKKAFFYDSLAKGTSSISRRINK
jgi:hypothetical protein